MTAIYTTPKTFRTLNSWGRKPLPVQRVMGQWLKDSFVFTEFVTLTTNSSTISPNVMRSKLREWDARVNRRLYGPKWSSHPDDLIWFFAFLEKPAANPHWHLLLRLPGRWASSSSSQSNQFRFIADAVWMRLMPSGTTDVQAVNPSLYSKVEDYVAKELQGELQYTHFVTPDEFR